MNVIILRRNPTDEDRGYTSEIEAGVEGVEQGNHTQESIPNETSTEPLLPVGVSFDGSSLVLQVNTDYNGAEINDAITLDIDTTKNYAYEVSVKGGLQFATIISYPIFNYVDHSYGMGNIMSDIKKIARIVVDADAGNLIIQICLPSDEVSGFENVCIATKFTSTGLLATYSPWLADRLTVLSKKAKMLNNTDIYRSVSYLESQVDLLTRIVLTMAPESALVDLLSLADGNSVLNIKPLDDIKQEFIVNKKALRKDQEAYYEHLKT